MTTDAWARADYEERIHELTIAKAAALGAVLGVVDAVLLAEQHPTVFSLTEKLRGLREAREAYDVADTAYRDARKAAI